MGLPVLGINSQPSIVSWSKISYDDKIVRSGENEKILFLYENALSPTENNLISQIFKRDELDELFREQKMAASYEYEWHPGLMNKISANYIRHFSPEFYPFLRCRITGRSGISC